jgi:hypothetical protein
LNGKVQKHQNFEQELGANKSRMEEITSTGQELIESEHYAAGKLMCWTDRSNHMAMVAMQSHNHNVIPTAGRAL